MKQKLISLPHVDVMVVGLPEGAINPVISMGYITARIPNHEYGIPTHDLWDYKKNEEYMAKYDPSKEYDDWAKKLDVDGKWKLLGRLPELTEEDSGEIVVFHPKQKGYVQKYVTAKDALNILLQANGIYFENTLGKEPDITAAETDDISDWILAQQQVWDRNRTHIFIKQK